MRQFNWILLVVIFFSLQTKVWSQEETEVKVKTELGKIYGTLTSVPHKENPPIVIIIPGSGPTDRNGNGGVLQCNTYKLLAQGLSGKGIACLRYDKLGIGESTSKIEEKDMRFEDNVKQVDAWIDFLNKEGYNEIILIGHSEGSLIGMLAAQERKVQEFISLEGAGRTIDKILVEQISKQSPKYESECADILAKLKGGNMVPDFSPELASIFRMSVQPYLISWIKYDPMQEIGKLDIPVLIVQGLADIQVTEEDADRLQNGNPKAKLIKIIGMNHILKPAPIDREKNIKTYYDPYLPLNTQLVPTILKFILEIKPPDQQK